MTTAAVLGASSRPRNVTAGGVPIPNGWALQRLDTFGTAGSIPGPVRAHTLYFESAPWNRDANDRTFIPNGIINGQQQTYQHFEDPTWVWNGNTDRVTIQGRGQGDNSIKSGQFVSRLTARSFMFEARIKVPSTLGTWNEFWAFGNSGDTSELDVELVVSVDGTSHTVHTPTLNTHPALTPTLDDPNATYDSGTGFIGYSNASFSFATPHYYTIYYDDTGSGTTRRYIDGVLIYHAPFKWNASLGGAGFGPDAMMLLDLAAGTTFGGNFPGTIATPSAYSGDMDIYSIGFYTPGSAGRAIPAGQAWNFGFVNAHCTLSNNDLTVTTSTSGTNQSCFALDPVMSGTGKYYWEVVVSGSTSTIGAGVGTYKSTIADGNYVGQNPDTVGWYATASVVNNNAVVNTWAAFTSGARLCFAIDMVNLKIWGRVGAAGNWNNAAIGSQNPATNTGGLALPANCQFFVVPAVNLGTASDTATGVFASGSWVGTPPAGFGQIGPT